MSRAKGSPKTGGRKKGTPNKSSEELRRLFSAQPDKIIEELDLIESPLERIKIRLKLLDFSFPKLKSIEFVPLLEPEPEPKPKVLCENCAEYENMSEEEQKAQLEEIKRLIKLEEELA